MPYSFKRFTMLNENKNYDYLANLSIVKSKLPELLKLEQYVIYGNFNELKKPVSDKELEQNNYLLKLAVTKFDELFNTDYFKKYGLDYDLLVKDPTIKKVYYGDVVRQLCIDAFKFDVFRNVNVESAKSISDLVIAFIIMDYIKDEQGIVKLQKYFKDVMFMKIPKIVNKKELLYLFFKNNGTEFTTDKINEIFNIKNKKNTYLLGGTNVLADVYVQDIFLKSLKKAIDRFTDLVNTDKLYDIFIGYLKKEVVNSTELSTNIIHDKYIVSKLKSFLNYLKEI